LVAGDQRQSVVDGLVIALVSFGRFVLFGLVFICAYIILPIGSGWLTGIVFELVLVSELFEFVIIMRPGNVAY
jgi:hypothetical protein